MCCLNPNMEAGLKWPNKPITYNMDLMFLSEKFKNTACNLQFNHYFWIKQLDNSCKEICGHETDFLTNDQKCCDLFPWLWPCSPGWRQVAAGNQYLRCESCSHRRWTIKRWSLPNPDIISTTMDYAWSFPRFCHSICLFVCLLNIISLLDSSFHTPSGQKQVGAYDCETPTPPRLVTGPVENKLSLIHSEWTSSRLFSQYRILVKLICPMFNPLNM